MKVKRIKNKEVKVRLSDELHFKLKTIAKVHNVSMIDRVRLYIFEGLKRDEMDIPEKKTS